MCGRASTHIYLHKSGFAFSCLRNMESTSFFTSHDLSSTISSPHEWLSCGCWCWGLISNAFIPISRSCASIAYSYINFLFSTEPRVCWYLPRNQVFVTICSEELTDIDVSFSTLYFAFLCLQNSFNGYNQFGNFWRNINQELDLLLLVPW